MPGMGRAADAFDGIATRGLPRNPDDWRNVLTSRRAEFTADEFDAAVIDAIRTHVFADFEDPALDDELGDPVE